MDGSRYSRQVAEISSYIDRIAPMARNVTQEIVLRTTDVLHWGEFTMYLDKKHGLLKVYYGRGEDLVITARKTTADEVGNGEPFNPQFSYNDKKVEETMRHWQEFKKVISDAIERQKQFDQFTA